MTVLILLISGTLNVVCFLIGAKVGQMVVREERIELPKMPNPFRIVASMRENRIAKRNEETLEALLNNIEAYDGTAFGQKDIPN